MNWEKSRGVLSTEKNLKIAHNFLIYVLYNIQQM